MFIIKCESCGAEQNWGDGVVVGKDTVIEIAERAVFCECGAAVEEFQGTVVANTCSETNIDATIPASITKRELLQ